MFCTECGTKLPDNASFCTNCGYKMPEAAGMAMETQEAATVVNEPVQSLYTESASSSLYNESSSQTMGTTGAVGGASYGATQGVYGATQNAYDTTQNMYGAEQNMYGGNPTYNYNAQQPKKKGKGCLIAVIIASVVGILAVLLVVILIIFGATLFGGGSGVEDIYGYWTGTADLVSVSGEDEMQEYLEDLYGRPLSDSEIEGLSELVYDEFMQIDIYEYEDDYGNEYPGSWNMDIYMGSFFGTQNWDDWDALTYWEFDNDPGAGCIELNSGDKFEVGCTETDYLGEYGSIFFDSYDYDVEDWEVAEDGEYGITFTGEVTENSYGEKQIEGTIVITFEYGDMSKPYVMEFEYVLDDCSEY